MAQPVWETPAGSLGTIPERVFYQISMQVKPTTDTVYYQLIAGKLPLGIQCEETGLIAGTPFAIASLQGVPFEVGADVTSKFTIRAYTKKLVNNVLVVDRIADRTFTLTVTGQDAPRFITPAGTIASYYDGSLVSGLQIEYTDPDPGDIVTVKLASGQLPIGTTITNKGLISGFIAPNAPIAATAGYSRDGQGYDKYPYEFVTQSSNVTYQFTLEITDGKSSNLRTFNIIVYSRNSLTADNTNLTSDNTFVTADSIPGRVPIILTPQGSIGTTQNDNFYAFQFQGIDLDGDPFKYEMTGSIPGLTLDSGTGWLYGYLPNLGVTELVYDFSVRVYKTDNPTWISDPYEYSLTVTGPISSVITWLTPSDLGTIVNGSTSTLYVEAVNRDGLSLQYRLLSGSNSRLPQGLQLLPTGEIAGRVSFNTFALDLGTTTFDTDPQNGVVDPTTFDMACTFTVQVYSVNNVVNVTKTFTITVERVYNEPYENLYIQAMPPPDDRALISALLQNSDVFPPDLIYRYNDPNFGVAHSVVYNHAFGLTASTVDEYYAGLYENHYWKTLTLGEVKVAQARDANDNVIYEVVYSQVVDNLLNNQGESVSKQVLLPYSVNQLDGDPIELVYPNSLTNMRDQVIDTVGQVSKILPNWMTSKQDTGRVLGFIPAWVIAYAKPSQGNQIAYNINTQFNNKLNLIDFDVDRYEIDRLLSKNWDPHGSYVSHQAPPLPDVTVGPGVWNPYNPASSTTFDVEEYPTMGTYFDGGSLQFTAPNDMYSDTTDYNKYLVFPHRYIIDPATYSPSNFIAWLNNSAQVVTWRNTYGELVNWANNT